MKSRKLRIVVLIALVAGIAGLVFALFMRDGQKKEPVTQLKLHRQTLVENYLKTEVQPMNVTGKHTVMFDVFLESFQYPELTEMDVNRIFLLEDIEKNVVKPTHIKELSRTRYNRRLAISFYLNTEVPPVLRLTMFGATPNVFIWSESEKITTPNLTE